jgi:hypothetical protein
VLQRNRILIETAKPRRPLQDVPDFQSDNVVDDLMFELACLRGIGPIVLIDLTQPAFGIPVVRVVTPRLRGLSPQLPPEVLDESPDGTVRSGGLVPQVATP